MSYLLNTPYSSREIYLNSDDADRTIADDTNFCIFVFKSIVEVPQNVNILLSIKDAQIPVSFTNVNSNNNTFKYTIGATTTSISIAVGNYTANTLRDKLNTDLAGVFTFTYDSTTNKFTITHVSSDFTLESDSGLIRVLGFTVKDHVSTSQSVTSDSVVDLSGLGGIFIQTNYITSSQDSKTKNLTSILQKIPINQSGNGIVFYTNKSGYKTQIFEKNINEIHIKILDEDQRLLDMNKARWRLTLGLDFVYQENYRDIETREQLLRRLPVRKKTQLIAKNNISSE
tara:strand:- start:1899 stop:2753 length:855 start_codon:yes stop_codon:yes gene_type:complete